ncbi:MAG TPA: type II toxin-antitoxin system VapC family toxin [Ilumatobacteraceae bacterium]|nr:type II toxin-antitoxin system VapC family toxin [Ilumatobacteraceae bacterium]
MRQLLLDTHVALWAFASPELLRPEVRSALTDPLNTVMVSAISIWEVEIKRALGTLDAPQGFAALCIDRGFDALDVSFRHAEVAGALPPHHGDPFDRMLVAQAMTEGFELVTTDPAMSAYDVRLVAAT